MPSESNMLYKLIILFTLNKVDFPMTNLQISNFILEKDYTDYFTIQQSISELIEEDFISCEPVGHNFHYRLTSSGRETLYFFKHSIPTAIQEDILQFLKKNKYALRDEVSVLSEYYEGKKGEFFTRLRVMEQNESIIDMNIAVPSEEQATKMCRNWRSKSQKIYEFTLSNLLNDE